MRRRGWEARRCTPSTQGSNEALHPSYFQGWQSPLSLWKSLFTGIVGHQVRARLFGGALRKFQENQDILISAQVTGKGEGRCHGRVDNNESTTHGDFLARYRMPMRPSGAPGTLRKSSSDLISKRELSDPTKWG